MVARPPVKVVVAPMTVADLPEVQAIERASFTTPWPAHAYRAELETNRLAHYVVARAGGDVVGFAGLWLMVDEAHVTTFAVAPAWRRRRIGERMLLVLLDLAGARGAREATLEVRLSNLGARRLYEKFGFRPVGLRPRYYSDNNEDALIMTTETLDGEFMRERVARLRASLDAAGEPDGPNEPGTPNRPDGQDGSSRGGPPSTDDREPRNRRDPTHPDEERGAAPGDGGRGNRVADGDLL